MKKSPSRRIALALGACLTLAALAAPLAAQGNGQKPRERREALTPIYRALQSNPEFQAFKRDLVARPNDAALLERFLRFLPLSPLDYLNIDMEERRYEMMVPREVHELHAQWVRLHEEKARDLYGDAQVDAILSNWPADPPEKSDASSQPPLVNLSAAATVDPNRNVAATDVPPPNEYQGEIQVAVNPNNANQLVAAANTWDAPAGCQQTQAVFWSGDGGATWNYTCAPTNTAFTGLSCGNTVFGSDPALAWDSNNNVYLNYMLICSFFGFINNYAMVVARSTDGGATWLGQGVVVNSWNDSDVEDKNFYDIDRTSTSPFFGRHYTCWDRNNNEKFAYSTNSGATWTEVDLPTSPFGGVDLGCEIAVEDNGTVHVVWNSLTCGTSTCSDESMMYTRSTNGGVSWSAPVRVRDFNLAGFSGANCPDAQDDRCISTFGAIGVDNTGGACDGTLYATFTDHTGTNVNDADVWVSRSTNGGSTWSAPVKVNDDGLAGRIQFHPFLQVDQSNGNVVVAWHDARNDAGNDAVEYFASRSTDCGLTFEANTRASEASSEFNNSTTTSSNVNSVDNPNYNPNQYGEYMGLDVLNGKAYLAWSDTRHYFPGSTTNAQKDNLGFAVVTFGPPPPPPVCGNNVKETGEICDGTDLAGQTCATQGFASGTLSCNATCSAFVTTACVGAPPTTTTFISVAAEDGYIEESSETSGVGGSANSTASNTSALRAGDERRDRQYRSILSFDTAAIPDGATVQTVTLRVRRASLTGTSPFTTHGNLSVDVQNGGFNGNVALETADFQAAATATAVCNLSNAAANNDWSECTWNAAGLLAINKTGKTQVRFAFTLDDNDDGGNDYLGYYSANNGTAANHPQLVVTYQ